MNIRKIYCVIAALCLTLPLAAQDRPVRFFAHRGGRMEFDENTISAFEASYKAGYRGYETDVRLTADGKLVILHDSSLERTSNGSGKVEELTEKQIRKFKTRKGNDIMFLDDLMRWLRSKGDVNYVEFELKTNPVELYPEEKLYPYVEKIYQTVMKYKPEGALYLFTSFDYRGLRYLQQNHPDAQLMILTKRPCCDESIRLCETLGIMRMGATIDGTSREAVRKAHDKGITVSLWPGKSVDDALFGVYVGADYLCSDVPVAVREFIETKTPWINASY